MTFKKQSKSKAMLLMSVFIITLMSDIANAGRWDSDASSSSHDSAADCQNFQTFNAAKKQCLCDDAKALAVKGGLCLMPGQSHNTLFVACRPDNTDACVVGRDICLNYECVCSNSQCLHSNQVCTQETTHGSCVQCTDEFLFNCKDTQICFQNKCQCDPTKCQATGDNKSCQSGECKCDPVLCRTIDSTKPLCSCDELCVQCNQNSDCAIQGHVCVDQQCVCSDTKCDQKNPDPSSNKVCSSLDASGQCVQCRFDQQCSFKGAGWVCDESTHLCQVCTPTKHGICQDYQGCTADFKCACDNNLCQKPNLGFTCVDSFGVPVASLTDPNANCQCQDTYCGTIESGTICLQPRSDVQGKCVFCVNDTQCLQPTGGLACEDTSSNTCRCSDAECFVKYDLATGTVVRNGNIRCKQLGSTNPECQQCRTQDHCQPWQICSQGVCICQDTRCLTYNFGANPVCSIEDETGICAQCRCDNDCSGGQVCDANVCVACIETPLNLGTCEYWQTCNGNQCVCNPATCQDNYLGFACVDGNTQVTTADNPNALCQCFNAQCNAIAINEVCMDQFSTQNGQCVQCVDDAQCALIASNDGFACDTSIYKCTCQDTECDKKHNSITGDSSGKLVCKQLGSTTINECVQCRDQTQCGTGQLCVNYQCACQDSKCNLDTTGAQPHCSATGTCVVCTQNCHCAGNTNGQVCNALTNDCVFCLVDSDCKDYQICDTLTGPVNQCVCNNALCGLKGDGMACAISNVAVADNTQGAICQCLNSQCDLFSTSYICEVPNSVVNGACVNCLTNLDCLYIGGSTQIVCNSAHQCVCDDTQCPLNTVCKQPGTANNFGCVQCRDQTQCGTGQLCVNYQCVCQDSKCNLDTTGAQPHCSATGTCVVCTQNCHCAGNTNGQVCNALTNDCVFCLVDSDCKDYQICDTLTGPVNQCVCNNALCGLKGDGMACAISNVAVADNTQGAICQCLNSVCNLFSTNYICEAPNSVINGACVNCLTNLDCSYIGGSTQIVCNSAHQCVCDDTQCPVNTVCKQPGTANNFGCVQCRSNTECASQPGKVCQQNVCICQDRQCASLATGKNYCSSQNAIGVCETCVLDSQCAQPANCDTTTSGGSFCFTCTQNSECTNWCSNNNFLPDKCTCQNSKCLGFVASPIIIDQSLGNTNNADYTIDTTTIPGQTTITKTGTNTNYAIFSTSLPTSGQQQIVIDILDAATQFFLVPGSAVQAAGAMDYLNTNSIIYLDQTTYFTQDSTNPSTGTYFNVNDRLLIKLDWDARLVSFEIDASPSLPTLIATLPMPASFGTSVYLGLNNNAATPPVDIAIVY